MQIYDVEGCIPAIAQMTTGITTWVNGLTVKPYAVCNASLYDFATRIPIGTIIENGKLVHNDGNGYGYGIIENKSQFGSPWTKIWDDYISGYNSPVQNGVYTPPTFNDTYVFNTPNVRIGIGEKSGRLSIITDDNVTLRQFAEHAISMGVKTLVNLDGGGSRHLYYNGKTIYQSPRVPYNALVFWKNGQVNTDPKPSKEECPYPEPVRNLMYGSRGEDVKWLQWYLNKKGFACGIDGQFYYETWKCVWNFQKTWTKWPDGIAGPNTRRELLK